MKCKVCCSAAFRKIYRVNDLKHFTTKKSFLVQKCRNCHIFVVTENGDQVETVNYYPSEYSAYSDSQKEFRNFKYPFNVVKGRTAWTEIVEITPEMALLDVGSGSGDIMNYIQNKFSCKVIGLEPSQEAVSLGHQRGRDIRLGTLKDTNIERQMDLIYLSHVVEHFDDPLEDLKICKDLLKDGGKIVICTPQTRSLERLVFGRYWDGWDTPRHIYVFNSSNMKFLLQKAGFINIEVYYEVYSIFKRSLLNMVYRNPRKRDIPWILDKFLNKIDFILSWILPFFRYSGAMQVIAEKK